MTSFWNLFTSDQNFMPHIHCYLGLRSLVWTMALTDTLIGLSYISISLSLIYLIRKIKIPFFPIFLSFATFITTCAATHFMEVVTLWSPFYWLSAGFKTVTAIASIITALFLIRIEKKVIEFSEAVKTSKQQLLEIQNQARLLMISNEELKKSEERYRLLVAGVTDYAIFSLDLNGRIQSWNDGAKKVKQYESNEIIGKDFSCFYIDELVKIGKPKLALAAALKLGHFEEEGLRVRKDGTQFWANVVITPIRSHDGTAIGFTKITKDLTAKRAVEDERDKLKLEMALKEEGLKLKNNFLGVMSHEMRTPVNGIVGITSLLQKTELSTEQKELSELILVSGKNLLAVVDDILDFSKLEKGMNQLELVDFSMTELVNESTLLLKNAAFKKGLFFDVEIHPVFSSTLRGDFGLLEQVLKNIVGNAVKFTERGGIQLKVSGLPLQDQDFSVRFEISDSGIGISEIALLNLFRPFSQIDNSTRRLHSGIGLGLSSSKLILRTMGGNIGAQSNEKSGCLFWFEVPLRLSSQVNRDPKWNESEKTIIPENPLHILVAEDNPINQVVTLRMIRSLGHTALAADDGFQAVEAVKKNNFDLVLMDCQMPGMDGLEATRLIREMGILGKIPIVALTANTQLADRIKCLNCGMNDFLAKPAGMKAINEVILKWTKKRQAA